MKIARINKNGKIKRLIPKIEMKKANSKISVNMKIAKTTKKEVVAVLRGESVQEIIYKDVPFRYCANNMTYKDCNEHIKDRLDNYISKKKY